ncbi:transposase [Streptomyces sp. SID12501]|uniref:Transposase n=1 Tax=Streptomyces sp. SID12501 TaxID=2706042 RepID=A0A6B3BM74_9ACTN|nr:transposase [Streptomyces sp. SID12501]NEC84866.1 transposase [Streptomyces sp. SID12501]
MYPAKECVPPAHRLFAHLPRADQRRWAGVYLKGLLATQGKKSLRRIAASVTPSPTAPQSLQQFVNDSAWQWRPVRAELARWAAEHTAAHAWTLSPVVIPKRGELSVGVHRRFVPAFGRTVNCQLALGAFLSGDLGDLAVDWQLYLPRRWTEDARLRRQARIPEATGHATAAELCLALADRLARITPEMPPVVVHTDGHIDAAAVIEGLQARGLDWIVAVPDTLPLSLAASAGPHPADAAALHPAPEPAGDLLRRHARPPTATPLAPGQPRLRTTEVLLPAGTRPALLVGVRTASRLRPDRLWLTNLPPARRDRALAVIGSATTARAGVAEAELGLHDFAGRSYPGWHRHATLVSVASAHRRLGHEVCLAPNSG